MSYRLDLRLSAEMDIHEAAMWYRDIHAHLEAELLFWFEEAFQRAIRQPLIYQKTYDNVRRINVRRFPYAMYFYVEDNVVIAFAVTNSYRHPKIWKNRV
jgi:hypothetical protein